MATIAIAIIRHGERENSEIYSWKTQGEGGCDTPLKSGQESIAKKVAESLRDKGFASAPIYCSPLLRTRQTAELLKSAGLSGRVTYSDKLRELKAGTLDGTPVPLLDESLSTQEKWSIHEHNAKAVGGGESVEELTDRVSSLVKDLKNLAEEKAIFITHGSPSRALILNLTKEDVCLSQWGVHFINLPIE